MNPYPAFLESIDQLRTVLADCHALTGDVTSAGSAIIASLEQGGTLFTCGNGGSAADALHLTQELIGRFKAVRRPLRSVCINADGPALTCICNDYGYAEVFARQIAALGRQGDVLVGFTTSGNSRNVLTAFGAAAQLGMVTILLSGMEGGAARGVCNHEILVPSRTISRIQEVHTLILHQWLEAIDVHQWP